jgi:hypothetical protein
MGGLQPVSNKSVTIMCFAWRTLLAKANMPNESESRYAPSLVLLMRGQRANDETTTFVTASMGSNPPGVGRFS